MKKIILPALLVLLLAAGIVLLGANQQPVETAMTELSIDKMTCGSCVSTINEALAELDGIQQVDISVTTGRGQILYDPQRLDAGTIAATVTDCGYPAAVQLELSGADYQALKSEESHLAENYLARIGDRLIPRRAFQERLELELASLPLNDRAAATRQLSARLWQDIQERELLLADADQNQVVVQPGEVELRLKELRAKTADFDQTVLPRYGGEEQFLKRLKEDMIINRNIEEHVIAGISDRALQRDALNRWYQQLVQQTPVVIYDPQLKQLAAGSGGCGSGGGCCSS